MTIGDSIIGRDRELAQLELAVGRGDDGLRLVMVTGPSGMGKTTLSSVAAAQAGDRGFDVIRADGRAGSLSTPFAPWVEAIPELASTVHSSDGSAPDIEQVGAILVGLLTDRAAQTPVLLMFDDAQALDESSIALLPYATGISERANMTLLLVEQSDAVDVSPSYRSFADTLLARRVVQHFELGPMSDASIGELVRHVLQLDPDTAVPTEIVLRAQGNPWFAKELADSYSRGDTEIPTSIAAAATARLGQLDQIGQDLTNIIAICPEGAYIGWLEAAPDQRARELARTMAAIKDSGLIREDGDIISIAHPLMQQALLDELSAAMRRALHLELAATVATVPMSEVTSSRAQGYHLSQAGKPTDAVEHYLRAAESSEVLGQLHEAFIDYVRAMECEPRLEERAELLKRCGFAGAQLSSERTMEFWSELARIATVRGDNPMYAYALVHQYWSSADDIDRLRRAADLGVESYGWSAQAALGMAILEADYHRAIEHGEVALRLARDDSDQYLECQVLWNLGLAHSYTGSLDKAIEYLEQSVRSAMAQRLHERALFARVTLAETLAENLETQRAVSECQAIIKYVDDLGLERYRPSAHAFLAHALVRVAKLEDALKQAELAVEAQLRVPNDRYTSLIWLIRSEVAAEIGDLNGGLSIAQTAVDVALEANNASWIFDARLDQGRLMAREGRYDDALEAVADLELPEATSMANLALWMSRVGLGHDRADFLSRAKELRASIDSDVPLVRLICAEIDATISGKPKDLTALQNVVKEWSEASRPLDSLRASVSMGMIMKAKNPADAIALLSEVRKQLTEIGAAWDADFVAGVLRSLGTRSRARSRSTTVGNLTKRELEIARLVASGLRNAEVAGKLFLAEKTVAAHLSNIYGKLEIRSRVQLSAWLSENDEPAAAATG